MAVRRSGFGIVSLIHLNGNFELDKWFICQEITEDICTVHKRNMAMK
jgi:hypothetical protein